MKAVGFEFRKDSRFQLGAVKDAEAIGKRLEELKKKAGGELTPAAVVDDAKDKASPLHSYFEWNDTAAAREHRLSQARTLIRAVIAIYKEDDDGADREPLRIVAYSHIAGLGDPHYRGTAEALAAPDTRAVILRRAMQEAQAWRQRYKELSELSKVFAALDETDDLFRKEG